ncbi:MAG: hypothetical protein ACM3U2_11400 [Deltaproteobacteria bacterium]
MDHPELNRRDFHRLTVAAFGGVVAGTLAGCGEEKKPAGAGATPGGPGPGAAPPKGGGDEVAVAKGEPHACRGLNACKGQGADGKNECAGQGACATKAWHHSCSGQNDCKGQGGCGDNPTQNDCKGQGKCNVPLMDSVWDAARKHFEETMKNDNKEFGAAPAKKKKS